MLPVACVIAAQLLLINYAKAISQFPTRRGKPSAIAFTWPPAENSDRANDAPGTADSRWGNQQYPIGNLERLVQIMGDEQRSGLATAYER